MLIPVPGAIDGPRPEPRQVRGRDLAEFRLTSIANIRRDWQQEMRKAATSAAAPAATAGAGQNALQLLARRAGVHVDFHAHRHFDDLRSFPSHLGLPSSMVQHSHRAERKTAARLTQGLVRRTSPIGLSQQTQQRASCRRAQLLRIERSIAVRVCRIEALFDDRQIFIQRQRSVMIGIGGRKLARAQPARQFASVERPVVVGIEPCKQAAAAFFTSAGRACRPRRCRTS